MLFYIIRIYLADKYNYNKMIIIITITSRPANNTSSGLFNSSILLFIQANICNVINYDQDAYFYLYRQCQ